MLVLSSSYYFASSRIIEVDDAVIVPSAMVAEFLAAGLNPNCWGLEQSPGLVEAQVIAWMSELLLDDSTASGVLVSSASVANAVSANPR